MPSSEPPSNIAELLSIAVVLLILSCLFSMSESAFLSVNKLRIRFLRRKKVKKAIRVGKLLDKQDELINTILIGNNIPLPKKGCQNRINLLGSIRANERYFHTYG